MEWASELIKRINKDNSFYKESRYGKHEIKTNVERTFRQISGHTECKNRKEDGEKQTTTKNNASINNERRHCYFCILFFV